MVCVTAVWRTWLRWWRGTIWSEDIWLCLSEPRYWSTILPPRMGSSWNWGPLRSRRHLWLVDSAVSLWEFGKICKTIWFVIQPEERLEKNVTLRMTLNILLSDLHLNIAGTRSSRSLPEVHFACTRYLCNDSYGQFLRNTCNVRHKVQFYIPKASLRLPVKIRFFGPSRFKADGSFTVINDMKLLCCETDWGSFKWHLNT